MSALSVGILKERSRLTFIDSMDVVDEISPISFVYMAVAENVLG